jgi:hypothetical protein
MKTLLFFFASSTENIAEKFIKVIGIIHSVSIDIKMLQLSKKT